MWQRHLWVTLVAALAMSPLLALPLYLYFREVRSEVLSSEKL